ncbi:MAG: hypothetical protein JWO80_2773 [Bryobacterales bacterium]|nr:hypothetical protein [Bryobacterales bacterium]
MVGAEFVCIQQASAGSFTIPAPVLLSLPPSTTITTGIPSGFLGVGYFVGQVFTAAGLDQATVSASGFSLQTVTYQ